MNIINAVLITLVAWIIISLIICVILDIFYESENAFVWFDFWIGMHYDNDKKILYINPFPTLGYRFYLTKRVRR